MTGPVEADYTSQLFGRSVADCYMNRLVNWISQIQMVETYRDLMFRKFTNGHTLVPSSVSITFSPDRVVVEEIERATVSDGSSQRPEASDGLEP